MKMLSGKDHSLPEALPDITKGMPGTSDGAEAGLENSLISDGLKSRLVLWNAALKTILGRSTDTTHSESFLGNILTRIKQFASMAASTAALILLPKAAAALRGIIRKEPGEVKY
ncbi:hypothetical protein N0V82_001224 [Gnomoniopsis sp. IMI 355080]|nr:hypothetical protein N0V82_001224 [Gnomoniopsis sp. IMI 355080]